MRLPLKRRHKFLLCTLALTYVIIEGLCYYAIYHTPIGKIFFYIPSVANYHIYSDVREPVLGWTFKEREGMDAVGARVTPEFPDPSQYPALVSVYGDSWTFSAQVGPADSYPNALAELLRCNVHNFGVAGYGTDQAYLRFKNNSRDDAEIVVLGHLSMNVMRNVNQFHDLFSSAGGFVFAFKPRFVLNGNNELKLIPLPKATSSEEQFLECVKTPSKFLRHDYFLPGGPSGVQAPGFSYLLGIVGIRHHYRYTSMRSGTPAWQPFYDPDHPSKALQVTTAVVRAFFDEARRRGKTPVFAVFVSEVDLLLYYDTGRWTFQPLLDNLDAFGLPYVNTGSYFADELGERDMNKLYINGRDHPTPEGYRLQAIAVYRHLVERGLVPPDVDHAKHNAKTASAG